MHDFRFKLSNESTETCELFYACKTIANAQDWDIQRTHFMNVGILFAIIPDGDNRSIPLSIHCLEEIEQLSLQSPESKLAYNIQEPISFAVKAPMRRYRGIHGTVHRI